MYTENTDTLFQPEDLAGLSGEAQLAMKAIAVKYAKIVQSLAPEHAAAFEHVKAHWKAVHKANRLAQTAQADQVIFENSVGAQAAQGSKLKEAAVFATLTAAAAAETNFAFPAVRYATGQTGVLSSPLDDPVSLAAATAIGLLSLGAAHFAGEQFSWSERSLMHDPKPAEVNADVQTPDAVRADPTSKEVLETSPLADMLEPARRAVDRQTMLPGMAAAQSVPASAEVGGEAARKRFKPVLSDTRSAGLRRKIGIALVVGGIGLWSINGMLRAAYLEKLSGPKTTVVTGLFKPAPALPRAEGMSQTQLEIAVIGMSILLFLISVGIVFAAHAPSELRGKTLSRRTKKAEKHLLKRVKAADKAIRTYEKSRAAIEIAKIEAQNVAATARISRKATS